MKAKIVEMTVRNEKPGRYTRVYIWPENFNVLDDLLERASGSFEMRDRRWEFYRKEVMPGVLARLGQPDLKFRFERKAGCACGCSPGFVLTNHKGSEVAVTIQVVAS